MNGLIATLVPLHVAANLVWIGSIVAVGLLLTTTTVDARTRGTLALTTYRKLSVPGFVASSVAGSFLLLLRLDYYFVQTKFMHGKLLLALVVIAFHHLLGGRAKKMAQGSVDDGGRAGTYQAVLIISAFFAVFLAVTKPF